MRRFFINSREIDGNQARIVGTDVHHIRDVLRLKPGEKIILLDESASRYGVEITKISADTIVTQILTTYRPEAPSIFLALFQGLPKGSKFDEVVEKATELGADRIAPVLMERSVPRPGKSLDARVTRWRRVGEAAAKQCRRPTLPHVDIPISFPRLIDELTEFDMTVVFWEGATEHVDDSLSDFDASRLAVVIGPEGGLAAAEVALLTKIGAKFAWLGPRILRTETAPIAALAIVNNILRR